MVYHPPFLGIIFGCVPLDFVDLKNALPRTRSSENGTLDLLCSLSVPFAFFLCSLSVPFPFLFAFPKRSGNAFPVRLLLSGTVYEQWIFKGIECSKFLHVLTLLTAVSN